MPTDDSTRIVFPWATSACISDIIVNIPEPFGNITGWFRSGRQQQDISLCDILLEPSQTPAEFRKWSARPRLFPALYTLLTSFVSIHVLVQIHPISTSTTTSMELQSDSSRPSSPAMNGKSASTSAVAKPPGTQARCVSFAFHVATSRQRMLTG